MERRLDQGDLKPPVNVALPQIVSRPQWLRARQRLLTREKEPIASATR
jgi:hypothetical protein